MKTILVALDRSEQSGRALKLAIELAKATGAELVLLHVDDYGAAAERSLAAVKFREEIRNEASLLPGFLTGTHDLMREQRELLDAPVNDDIDETILADAAGEAMKAGVRGRVLTRRGDAGTEIAAAAKEAGAELVVIGRRGLKGIQETILGSVSLDVIRKSQRNVLTVT